VTPESDGFPEAWYLPAANNIPAGYATQGSDFAQIAAVPVVEPGAAYFQYRNDQRATTLWFHDHSLGITRLNIYAGPTGFYILRGGDSDLPQAGNPSVLPGGAYEIPMVIQERAFLDTGALDFAFDNGSGDTMVVNGNTWPSLNVEPRRYRFRFLNASNENPIDLELATDNTPGDNSIDDGAWTALVNPFWQIGADGGFLSGPAAANVQNIVLHIAERADVIVDFSAFTPGDVIYLVNNQGDVGTTGQVIRFVVVALTSADTSTPADQLVLPAFTPLGPADFTRQVSANDGVGGPGKLLGTVNPGPPAVGIPLRWEAAITETPVFNTTEIWEIFNFDGGDHPIHLHLVQFEILDRTPIGDVIGGPTTTPPGPGETGTKDTVFIDGNTVTRVKAKFDIPGLFVWHCHILDHEDDEMMRPYEVGVVEPLVLVTPNAAGLVIPAGSDYTISWGGNAAATSFKIQYSFDNGATWKLVADNVLENSYPWSVPTFNKNFKTALIRVTAYDAGGTPLGNVVSLPFTIEVLKLESPDGGEVFAGGDNVTITWVTNGTTKPVGKVGLAYKRVGATKWRSIAPLEGNPGTYTWTLPTPPVDRQYKVRVTLKKANGDVIVRDVSDAPFTVNGPPLVAAP
jgi:FtsP/CotA-like multicopper oxidase with cupredoxin domain